MSNSSQIDKEFNKSSLPSPERINRTNSHHIDIEKSKEYKSVDQNEVFLDHIQFLQDMLRSFQKKFKEFEPVTEYAHCDSLKVLHSNKWKELSQSDIPAELSNLNDNLGKFLSNLYDKMRIMDGAVARLRNDYEKLDDQFKISRIKKETENQQLKYGSLSQNAALTFKNSKTVIENLENDKKSLKRKLKVQDTLIEEKKDEVENLLSEKRIFEDKWKTCSNENKLLKREIERLEENNDADIIKEIRVIQKQIKDKEIDSEAKNKKNSIDKIISSAFAKNMDHFISSSKEKELCDQASLEKVFEEMTLMRREIEQLRDLSSESLTEKERTAFEELKEREKNLIQKSEEQETTLEGMKNAIDNMKKKLQTSMDHESRYKQKKESFVLEISELKKGTAQLSEEVERKNRALETMKNKMKDLICSAKNSEELVNATSLLKQSNVEKDKLYGSMNKLSSTLKERYEECENLKKDNLRLHTELENMKKLNFLKKPLR